MTIEILGAGPAGASAAIAALQEGATVRLMEKSAFPRHKVCGEFLSPEALPLLEQLGVGAPGPRIARVCLRVGRHKKTWRLAEPARGVSRYYLDHALQQRAIRLGAELERQSAKSVSIIAGGRTPQHVAAPRFFGFKAHFSGSAGDALSLFVSPALYTGICAVEGGVVNVCGVAREDLLRGCGFEPDGLIRSWTRGLERRMNWLFTGPLPFGATAPAIGVYRAGDALGFIDPFTGTGILAALWSGIQAGRAAARGTGVAAYERECRRAFARQYRVAALLRKAVAVSVAAWLTPFAPGTLLFALTRPRL